MLGRVWVILNSKMLNILIIYCICGFKNQFWRQPGWRLFFSEKTRPWNFGTCFGDFELKINEHPNYFMVFLYKSAPPRPPYRPPLDENNSLGFNT